MKKITNIIYIAVFQITILTSGCDIAGLELQENAPYDHHVLDEHIDMSAWDYLNLPREDSAFFLIKEGIKYAGLEEEYKKPDRTFIFFTNDAVYDTTNGGKVAGGKIFSTYLTDQGDSARSWQDYTPDEVRDILEYHIFEGAYGYENLSPVNTEVNTLLDDKTAYMKIVNKRGSPLMLNDYPDSERAVSARSSNIHVTNGVVHVYNNFIVWWKKGKSPFLN